ncbi:hypothetical protein ACFSC3_17855 [Sphingomonas floccifaciens]|jgi:hypothetical protein|uniref:SRPBCC domain-containing protein n=2 Tax=Sphingomonas TaxID=13687 RepID=A0A916TAF7_9SPHN|nr:hypothetical protein [Sphingomonas metalli]GGB37858.1 hypothetical protein GCM10011380_29070 [Sphingomonas metalli]
MRQMITTIDTKASVGDVWMLLSNFAVYREWHPLVAMHGDAEFNATLAIEPTALRPGPDQPMLPARVIWYLPAQLIGWRLGIRRFLWIDETYQIIALVDGAQVLHEVRLSGWLAHSAQLMIRRRVMRYLERTDRALQDRLQKGKALARPALPSHGGSG